MSRRCAAFGLVLAALLTPPFLRAQDDRSRLDFWKANYTELTPADDPRAGRAAEIFGRIVAAAGKRGGVLPRSFIIKDAGRRRSPGHRPTRRRHRHLPPGPGYLL